MSYDNEFSGVELAERVVEVENCEHVWKVGERKTFNANAEKITEITHTCVKCGIWTEETVEGWK